MTNLDGVFRREWGPAVAALARWSGDLTVAEDAVQEAFADALRTWPRDGVPANAGGWIVTAARNRALDRLRRESVRPGKELAAVLDDITARTDRQGVPHRIRDDELRMMFTCAHPALDPQSQLALTLRLISGLTVTEIARALLQSEAAVGQRITRAKNKIRHANIPLRVPPPELLPERTPHVLACIYSVFTEGYWSTGGPSAIRDELCDEAVRLAGEVCSLMPDARDGHALAALMLLHDSRRQTRVDADGALVPLDEQDRSRWDRARITRGLDRLRRAAGATGPYLPQAVIAAHARDGPAMGGHRLGHDLRGVRPVDRDHRLPRCPGEPRPRGRVSRRVRRRPGSAGRGRRRSENGPVEHRRVDSRRSASARRPARRGAAVVPPSVGPRGLGPGATVPAPAVGECGGGKNTSDPHDS